MPIYINSQEVFLNRLGLDEGLSDLSVSCMVQDKINRIWIGTRDGLNCFDGNRVKLYKMEKGNTKTILGQIVYQLKSDDNYIWVLSDLGISRIDIETDEIKRFEDEIITSIHPYEGNLLFGTKEGVFLLNVHSWTSSRFTEIPHLEDGIRHIFVDKKNKYG